MLMISLTTALGCVLPIWSIGLGHAASFTWRFSGVVMCIFFLATLIPLAHFNSTRRIHEWPGYSRHNAWFMWSGGMVVFGSFLVCIVFAGSGLAPTVYSAAVVLSMAMAGLQFVRAAMTQLKVQDTPDA